MALYSGARQRPLGKDTSPLIADDLVLQLHTMVGNLSGTDRYFRTVGVFSHFGVGGIWGADADASLDGVVYQWGDTARRSAASLNGNHRVISIETADNAARPIQPWTAKQQDAIVGIMVWAHRTHGIPLVAIPDSKPGRTGIGWHRLGCDPYRVDGGELWSSSPGKDCPTQARIDQIPALIKRAQDIVNGTTTGGLHMDSDVQAAFDEIPNRVAARLNPLGTDVKTIITKVGQLLTALSAAGVDDAKRDAAVLTALGLVHADVDEQALAADLAPLLAQAGVSLDPATIAQAIRTDLAQALAS